MERLRLAGQIALAAFVVVALGACGKKKNGSVAATPATSCTLTAAGYVNSAGLQCSPTAQTCSYVNGQYLNPLGQACSPTSQCNANGLNNLGQVCTPYQYPGQYPYPQFQQQQGGCQTWTWTYGIQYVPVVLQGTLQCVRIDLLQNAGYSQPSYYDSGYYEDGYDYYYAYPPYSGQGCGFSVNFGGSWGNIGLCI